MSHLFSLNVKKTKLRDFILACVDISNCTNDKEKEQILDAAIEKGLFFGDESDAIHGVVGDGLEFFRPLVYALCEMLRDEVPFVVDFSKKFANSLVYDIGEERSGRRIDLNRGGILLSSEAKQIELKDSLLFEAFFTALMQYSSEKDTTLLKIPLGICLECDAIFLGRLPGQKFCSTEHGQRWRAREAYRQKKESDTAA